MALRKPIVGIPEGTPTALGELPTGDKIAGADVDLSSAAHNDLGGKEGTGPEFIHLNAAEVAQIIADSAALSAHIANMSNPHGVTPAQIGASPVGHIHAAGDITSGTFADARIAASNVVQHNGALTHAGLNGGGSPPIAAHPPVGGAAGQVLTKNSGANYDFGWATPAGGAIINEALQARRTTTLSPIPTAFTDITFDTNNVITNSAVINHSTVSLTDNMVAVLAGTYLVTYSGNIQIAPGNGDLWQVNSRVRLNDAGTGILGSHATTRVFSDNSIGANDPDEMFVHLEHTFIVTLAASDFITLQLQAQDISASAGTPTANELTFKMTRLRA